MKYNSIFMNIVFALTFLSATYSDNNSNPETPEKSKASDEVTPNSGTATTSTPIPTANQGDDFQFKLKKQYQLNSTLKIRKKTGILLPEIVDASPLPKINSFQESDCNIFARPKYLKLSPDPYIAMNLLAYADKDTGMQWFQIGSGQYILPAGTQVWVNGMAEPDIAVYPNNSALFVIKSRGQDFGLSGSFFMFPSPMIIRLPANSQIKYLSDSDSQGIGTPCNLTEDISDFQSHDKTGLCMKLPNKKVLDKFNLNN